MRLMTSPTSLQDLLVVLSIHSECELTDIDPRPYSPAGSLYPLRIWENSRSFFSAVQPATDVGLELPSISAEIRQATTWVVTDTARVDCLVQRELLSVCVGYRRNVLDSACYVVGVKYYLEWASISMSDIGKNLIASKLSLKRFHKRIPSVFS